MFLIKRMFILIQIKQFLFQLLYFLFIAIISTSGSINFFNFSLFFKK